MIFSKSRGAGQVSRGEGEQVGVHQSAAPRDRVAGTPRCIHPSLTGFLISLEAQYII